jgi:hypothetical protein
LRGLAAEQREEAGTVAALPLGLRLHALKLGLLLGRSVLIPFDLIVDGATLPLIDGGKLALQPLAHRAALATGRGETLRERNGWENTARERCGDQNGQGTEEARHAQIRLNSRGAANAASLTRFWRQGHVDF